MHLSAQLPCRPYMFYLLLWGLVLWGSHIPALLHVMAITRCAGVLASGCRAWQVEPVDEWRWWR